MDPEEIPRPARIDVDTAFASGALVVGSPATIREYLQRYAAETGRTTSSARFTGATSATRKPVVRSSCSRAKPSRPSFRAAEGQS